MSECFNWEGPLDKSNGYGYVGYGRRRKTVHRWTWEQHHGSIPKGSEVHHICENRACINPEHLKLVTKAQHALLNLNHFPAQNRAKTHCLKGHEFTEKNTYIWRGMRHCRECSRARCLEYYHRRRRNECHSGS